MGARAGGPHMANERPGTLTKSRPAAIGLAPDWYA